MKKQILDFSMKKNLFQKSIGILFFTTFIFFAYDTIEPPNYGKDEVTPIPKYHQSPLGDAEQGWDYLRYGGYIGAGVPYKIFKRSIKKELPNHLEREGKSANIPHNFNVFMENDVEVVGGLNCFGCHGGIVNGEFIAGLGDNKTDFSNDNNAKFFKNLQRFVRFRYGKRSGQYKAYLPLARGAEFVTPYIKTPFVGVNSAFKLEEAAVAHRNPSDLTWADGKQVFPITKENYGSDVPPLWNVQKKNALYYNGMGRGDFTKLLMQVMVVAIEDSTEAREIHENFDDILAWLNAIQPPKYPEPIDQNMADQGQRIFEEMCSKCHGVYGEEEDYPNLLVGLDVVKTDSVYAAYSYKNENFTNWLNSSWIMKSAPKAWVQPELGYVAPPLDGIWVTAPYLHNGAVPNLETLLDSKKRPIKWTRRKDVTQNYNYETVGLHYTEPTGETDKFTYDTTVKGYGNGGHTFADDLKDEHRKALIEYLKTL
jgi:mono/diheme cytochrome c family protein